MTETAAPADAEQPLWRPSPHGLADAAMFRFIRRVAERHGIAADYDALHQWSIARRDLFWPEVWDFCGVRASRRWHAALENGTAMPGARWFVGSRLNFAENLLRYRDAQPAIIFRGEGGASQTLTHGQLYAETARVSALLQSLGVKSGDRVAGYMSNCPQAVIAMLASASIGAVWSSCSPDFGVKGVLERFGQIKPRVLFAIDGYRYNGKSFAALESVAAVAAGLPSVERVIIVPFLNASLALASLPPALAPKALLFGQFTAARSDTTTDIEFAQLRFDHPLYILYSSGTTGAPKCIVHGAGGTLIQHLKEHQLHVDLRRADKLFYITTCGWMMWNWLVSGLASGAAIVLYDGAPFFPSGEALWKMAEEVGVSVFGASARYIAALDKAGIQPRANRDLSALRAILSTGSPLAPESFDYVYRRIKPEVMLSSIAGGTDIASCFVLGNPLRPVYRGEIQGRGLGMAVEVYDENGRSVRGRRGELVCVSPFPSMPLGFWPCDSTAKSDQSHYHAAYFARFDNVWTQGDYAEITAHDGFIIHGRSDAVLNPGGVRIGTAEIYRQVEKVEEVLESLCIGQAWQGDVRIVLFVVLRAGARLTDELQARIRDSVRRNASRRHVPTIIIHAPDIPRTLSGKIVELAVKRMVHGEPVDNTDALANPEALDYFRDLPALRQA